MFLSAKIDIKGQTTWYIFDKDELPASHLDMALSPVEGFILPSPGIIFRGVPLSQEFCIAMRDQELIDNLPWTQYLYDGSIYHIASGNKSVCDDSEHAIAKSGLSGDLCMLCQYNWWSRARVKF